MKKFSIILLVLLVSIVSAFVGLDKGKLFKTTDTAGLQLPQGFSASIFYDNLGRARHLSVAPNGEVFVKLSRLKDGKGIYKLTDANHDGVAETAVGFGNYTGTGIIVTANELFASSDQAVFKYAINNNVVDTANTVPLVKGLWNKRQHESKSLTLDGKGNIYVTI